MDKKEFNKIVKDVFTQYGFIKKKEKYFKPHFEGQFSERELPFASISASNRYESPVLVLRYSAHG